MDIKAAFDSHSKGVGTPDKELMRRLTKDARRGDIEAKRQLAKALTRKGLSQTCATCWNRMPHTWCSAIDPSKWNEILCNMWTPEPK